MEHLELGRLGEHITAVCLAEKGYEILERNYRWKHLEVDLICKDGEAVVFVEVKTRNSKFLGEPYLAVNGTKQRQLIKIANEYIRTKNIMNEVRFDVMSIVLNSSGAMKEHIENAFTP